MRLEDVIDFTPELRQKALAILERYDWGPLYTPPTERGTIFLPGVAGGASWSGAALDPETGRLYVTSRTLPFVTRLISPDGSLPIRDRYFADPQPLFGPEGLPLFKPPYGRIVAIDLNTGEHAWTVPLGEGPRKHPLLAALDLPRLGSGRRGFPLVTRTLLFAAQEGRVTALRPPKQPAWTRIFTWAPVEPTLEVFDKTTGDTARTGRAARERPGRADDLHGARPAVHRDSGRRRQPPCGADRAQPALDGPILIR